MQRNDEWFEFIRIIKVLHKDKNIRKYTESMNKLWEHGKFKEVELYSLKVASVRELLDVCLPLKIKEKYNGNIT